MRKVDRAMVELMHRMEAMALAEAEAQRRKKSGVLVLPRRIPDYQQNTRLPGLDMPTILTADIREYRLIKRWSLLRAVRKVSESAGRAYGKAWYVGLEQGRHEGSYEAISALIDAFTVPPRVILPWHTWPNTDNLNAIIWRIKGETKFFNTQLETMSGVARNTIRAILSTKGKKSRYPTSTRVAQCILVALREIARGRICEEIFE